MGYKMSAPDLKNQGRLLQKRDRYAMSGLAFVIIYKAV